ncbi:MAG: PAS domain-containing sensor histidine kinase [Acidobacteria bacterium]|nr:MAG: PAS domain-containing sensor histidine kinase [Acidobacteriota bacterium]
MPEERGIKFAWMDVLLLVFLASLAVLNPVSEIHAQLVLLSIGIFQVFERSFIGWAGRRGETYSILIKIGLATLLISHTGGVQPSINSSYYLIYYIPVVTAAMYSGPWGTLGWTALTSVAYCSFLIPALQEYTLTPSGAKELAIRILFFFLAAMLVNRFVMESRLQAERYRQVAEQLRETNKQLEQAQAEARRSERLAALGQLTAGLAHEIRNPLGVIKGSAETLGRKLPMEDPVARELAGYISSEVNRLNSLVSRFLSFAKPLELKKRPEDISQIVEHALKAAQEHWPSSRVAVERAYSPEIPAVPVDAELTEQVFKNLIFNAYEAMESAGGKLRVEVSKEFSDGRRGVEVAFSDTGPGVPPELREQIFNPFFTTKSNGVGLGLSIVSKIVDDHSGWIRVEPCSGSGACFRVFLPAE